jgi:hypothetical protein
MADKREDILMTSTYSSNISTLTLDDILKAKEMLDNLPPIPVLIFSQYTPIDKILQGEIVDQIAKQKDPYFNSERQKAYLINSRYEKDIMIELSSRRLMEDIK